jgi:hypothetical protein
MGGISFRGFYKQQRIDVVSLPRFSGDPVWVTMAVQFTTLSSLYILATEEWEAIVDENATYYIRL